MNCKKPISIGVWRVGCGQCLPCRINRRRLWSHRLVIEGEQHLEKCFVTLTYDNEHLPSGGTLVPLDFKNFLKRLRRRMEPKKLRFFGVGEYGEESQRPHYHTILFGLAPCPVRSAHGSALRAPCGCQSCTVVRSSWGNGRIDVAPFEEGVAQYVAKYVTKKMTSKDDPRLNGRHPEFARMSLKPGIGADGAAVLAEHLKQNLDLVLDENGDVPSAVWYGNKNKPLGQYLRKKLREELGIEKEMCMQKKAETLRQEKLQMQEDFKGHALWKEEQRLRDLDKQRVANIEAVFKIFENKGE